MIVIEGLKDGPVKGKSCILTLFGEGGVIQHFEDKALLVGKWKVLKTHGRLIDADEFKASIHMNHLGKFATNRDVQVLYRLLDKAPTVLEATE